MRINPNLTLALLPASLLMAVVACSLIPKQVELTGSSMEPNYPDGTRLFIEAIEPSELSRSDLVYYQLFDSEAFFVKRLIGLPGETVEIRSGVVYIDGSPLEEPYDVTSNPYNDGTWSLTEDQYFVLGDDRLHSSDSATWGPLDAASIRGRALPVD